jgi:hypothetical protein
MPKAEQHDDPCLHLTTLHSLTENAREIAFTAVPVRHYRPSRTTGWVSRQTRHAAALPHREAQGEATAQEADDVQRPPPTS